jgi:2-dehydropantoate 2-reductase
MKICIYGAGAIGGYLGAQLSLAGEDVSLIARGKHLEAMQRDGMTLRIDGDERIANPRCTSEPSDLEVQDFVFVTVKAHAVADILEPMQPLLGPETAVVWAVNGVPWWYFHGLDGPWRDRRIEAVDPGGKIGRSIDPERIIGCVVYPAAEVVEPGVVQHVEGKRFTLGEPSGGKTERVRELSKALINAGFRAPIRDIRNEMWMKLWGNLAFNPVSALTRATLDIVATDPGTREVCRRMMREAQSIGEALGARFGVDVDKRLDGGAAVGAHRTSMLQDLDRGRPLEIDSIVVAVQELARLVEVPTPTIDVVLALLKQRVEQKI